MTRKLPAGVRGDALFTDEGRRRLWLTRTWLPAEPTLGGYWLWIGMNPSVASGLVDDPTCAKEVLITQRGGGKGYVKCNVLDWIETDSTKLRLVAAPSSGENFTTIKRFANRADLIVCAWGNLPERQQFRVDYVTNNCLYKHELWCFGVNQNGSPKHSLYIRNDTPMQRYYPPQR